MKEQTTDAVNVETASTISKILKVMPVVTAVLGLVAGQITHCDYFQTSQKVEKTVSTLAPTKTSVVKLEGKLATKADATSVAVLSNDVKHLTKKVDGVKRKVEKLRSTMLNGFYSLQKSLQKRAAANPRAYPNYRYRKRVYTRPRR